MEDEKIKFRLVLPDGISDDDARYYRNMLQQSDIAGRGNVSFETVSEKDNTMGGALENVLVFFGKMLTFEPLLDFIQKLVHPVQVTITSSIDERGRISETYDGKAWTKRALVTLNKEYEKFRNISERNRPLFDVEFKLSSITGEDGKTVSSFDAQGLTSRSASKANELYKDYLDIVVSPK